MLWVPDSGLLVFGWIKQLVLCILLKRVCSSLCLRHASTEGPLQIPHGIPRLSATAIIPNKCLLGKIPVQNLLGRVSAVQRLPSMCSKRGVDQSSGDQESIVHK